MSAAPAVDRGRPLWRRGGVWAALAIVLVLGGVVLALAGSGATATPLDPASTAPSGSRALVRVAAGYGVTVRPTRSLAEATADPAAAVAVLDPDAYSDGQLRDLVRSVRRVVLVEPGVRASHAVSDIEPDTAEHAAPDGLPRCALPAARAAGALSAPDSATVYTGARVRCYGGLVAVTGRVVVLGSADLLRNDTLARDGVAALDVNLLSADRSAGTVVWLRPGPDADGSGATSVWQLFPSTAHRAFVWLLVVGGVLLLWRVRRLGAAVTEPLPVVVRAAELVEGHGRLYRRAHAVDRAAAALRAAALRRLAVRAGLPATSSPAQVCAALGALPDVDAVGAYGALAGPVPDDDRQLVRLADDLARLEQAVRDTSPGSVRKDLP